MDALPQLAWSEWKLWSRREEIEHCDWEGIYRIAVGDWRGLELKNGWNRVRYIGMSIRVEDAEKAGKPCGMRARWLELDKALRGRGGHSAGGRIFKEYKLLVGDKFTGKSSRNTLFVSAMPFSPRRQVPIDEPQSLSRQLREHGTVLYLEYAAFADYCLNVPNNPRPKFNRK